MATQEPLRRGGGPHEGESVTSQDSSKQKTQRHGISARPGMIGSMYSHLEKGIAPVGGGEPPPLGKRGLPRDKSDDGSGEEEDEESGTDEETVSVTSSNQTSAGQIKQQKWDEKKETYKSGPRDPPEDPNDLQGREILEVPTGDPKDIEVSKGELDLPVGMGPRGPWDLLAQEDFLGRMDCQLLLALLLLLDWGHHQYSMSI